jgi:hypothetical protein
MIDSTAKITIGTAWSGDHVYHLDDVKRLHGAVCRNTTLPFDFVLFAGPEAQKPGRLSGLDPGIHVIPSPFPSWWVGMPFSMRHPPGVNTDAKFAIGLDCVVTGNLDEILTYPSDFCAMKDYPAHACPKGRERDASLEVWLSRGGAGSEIWDEWVRLGCPQWDMSTAASQRVWPMCGQGWINGPDRPVEYDLFPENWIISYKLGVRKIGLPPGCRIVSFHGRPKPAELVNSIPWIKEHWR